MAHRRPREDQAVAAGSTVHQRSKYGAGTAEAITEAEFRTFPEAGVPMPLPTRCEVEAFERDGFVVLSDMLSPAWLTPLEDACERILAMPETQDITARAMRLTEMAQGDRAVLQEEGRAGKRGRFFVHFNTARRDPSVMAFVLAGRLGAIAAALLRSPTIRFVDDILFVKEANTYEATEWHDDELGGVTRGGFRCSLWVSLDDVPTETGPLCFLRGSHRMLAGWRERGLDADALVEQHASDLVGCPVRRGDVIAHHPAIIHGAGPNSSSTRRRSWAMRFAGKGGVRFVLSPLRSAERAWYGLEDGAPAEGPRFPIAWPPEAQ